ncbi:MAG: 30S ribosomal protein S15 [Candidatus Magasanikbacteria bacterium]|nr:30S ribosomal protein S15 [Candidatus Magasanikbacteria bacterium]
MLDKAAKEKIIAKFKTHETDTGSAEVQIAILTHEINELAGHLKQHKKDHSSRRGLLRKVGERRRLLRYLQKDNAESFAKIVKALRLKGGKQMMEEAALLVEKEVMPEIIEAPTV